MKIVKDPTPFRFDDIEKAKLFMASKGTVPYSKEYYDLMTLTVPPIIQEGTKLKRNPAYQEAPYQMVSYFNNDFTEGTKVLVQRG